MPERLEVAGEGRGVDATRFHRAPVVIVAVEALAACYQFHAPEQQVEAARPAGPLRVGTRVERALGERVADDEEKRGTELPERPLAQPALVRGRKVQLVPRIFAGLAED